MTKRAKKEQPKNNIIGFPGAPTIQKLKTEIESFDVDGVAIREYTIPACMARNAFFTDEDVTVSVVCTNYINHNEFIVFETESLRFGKLLYSPNYGWRVKDLSRDGGNDFYEASTVKNVRKLVSWKPLGKPKFNLNDAKTEGAR